MDGLETDGRAALTLKVIKSIEKIGVKIISLTGVGLAANVTTAEALGAQFDNRKSYFFSPIYREQKNYIIFDPPHMLKLVHKSFSSDNDYHKDQLIDRELLRTVAERQSSDNFNLCNNLCNKYSVIYGMASKTYECEVGCRNT